MLDLGPQIANRPVKTMARIESLRVAMQSRTMLNILRNEWSYARQRDLQIKDCQLLRVYPRRDEFLLEYELRLEDEIGGWTQVVFGELVGESARERCEATITSLRKPRRRQIAGDPADQVSWIPSLGLVIRFPGLDERLNGLKLVYKQKLAGQVFAEHGLLPDGELKRIEAQILGHRLGKRCVARFSYQIRNLETSQEETGSVITKLYKSRSQRGQQVFAAMGELRRRGFDDRSEIAIPRPIAYLDEWNTLLMTDMKGVWLPELVEDEFVAGVEAAGNALRKLHTSSLRVPERYGVDDEIRLLERWVALFGEFHPHLNRLALETLAFVRAGLERSRTFEPTLAHRDFYEKQILIDSGRVIMVDFDTLCQSDPAIDIGNFLAHLKLAALQREGQLSQAEEAFLEGYGPTMRDALERRVVLYTRASLLRLACLHAFWSRWSHLCEPLLEMANVV